MKELLLGALMVLSLAQNVYSQDADRLTLTKALMRQLEFCIRDGSTCIEEITDTLDEYEVSGVKKKSILLILKMNPKFLADELYEYLKQFEE